MNKDPRGESKTVVFTSKDDFTIDDLISAWPDGGLDRKVAEVVLQRCLRRVMPDMIWMPKYNGDPEKTDKLVWVVRGSLIVGKMFGQPMDFLPVFTCNAQTILPLNKNVSLEFRGGETGAMLIVLSEKLAANLSANSTFFERISGGFFDTINGIVQSASAVVTNNEIERLRRENEGLKAEGQDRDELIEKFGEKHRRETAKLTKKLENYKKILTRVRTLVGKLYNAATIKDMKDLAVEINTEVYAVEDPEEK
jgi:hypothetical protein